MFLGIDIGGTSVKGALLDGGCEVWTGKSGAYARPGVAELEAAVREVVRGAIAGTGGREVVAVGVCAPGLRDAIGVITKALNVPGLVGVSPAALIARAAPGLVAVRVMEFTDAHAAAADYWRTRPAVGRHLALSMGTGIGACVLDAPEGGKPVPLIVTGSGPGQIGQMDVGVEECEEETWAGKPMPRGTGTLESHMGLPALRARFGEDVGVLQAAVEDGRLRADRWPLCGLVRAMRIAHAIYLPERIVLLGGVGIRLRPLLGEMRALVADGLTSLAKPDWTLEAGESDFHAARGAAWMAGE